jgi:aspartyl-tRNA synthetase
MAEKKPLKRETFCGSVAEELVGREIEVFGWVSGKRELGGLTFIDLRDREGILQIVVNETFPDREPVKAIGREYVLRVQGKVARRSKPNPQLPTGSVELVAGEITVLAEAELPPFSPEGADSVSEELRFKHRFVDLRRQRMQKNLRLRSDAGMKVRTYLHQHGFIDVETPILAKATPEGARDYLVPSRVYKGKMFALPQSPQLFKQMLMVSGLERYYQLCRCFRDEDLRADRQPEFTQIDMEMSFSEPDELFSIVEGLIREIFAVRGIDVVAPFERMSYADAMAAYASDKPDLRIPFKIRDFTENALRLNSPVFDSVTRDGGKIRGLVVPDAVGFSRKNLDEIQEFVRSCGGSGVAWLRSSDGMFKASLKAEPERIGRFFAENGIPSTEIVFLIAGTPAQSLMLAGKLREHLGKKFTKKDDYRFLWVVDFPLFFQNEEEKRLDSNHHPFTSPRPEEIPLLDTDPLAVRSVAYDLVLNGTEIGGGSKRIHDMALQKKIFQLLNLGEEEIEDKFGFFLNALKFGTPPHLGIALGWDRILMLLAGEESIRDVIAFPKTTSSLCLLTGSPSVVSEKQLSELGITVKN